MIWDYSWWWDGWFSGVVVGVGLSCGDLWLSGVVSGLGLYICGGLLGLALGVGLVVLEWSY